MIRGTAKTKRKYTHYPNTTISRSVHATNKMLYPNLQSASGLSEWVADDVRINNESKGFTFFWDNEEHKAKLVAHRTNHFARFEFLPETKADEIGSAHV